MKIIRFSIQTSLWAKNHVGFSRLLIVLGFFLLTCTAICTGQLLYMQGIMITINVFWWALFVYVFSFAFYPHQKVSLKDPRGLVHYLQRKGCDLLLAGTTFVMIVQQGNSFFSETDRFVITETVQRVHAAYPVPVHPDESSWKAQKKEWRNTLKAFLFSAHALSAGEKFALTALAVVLAIALLYGIAMLSCNLSCSGAEGAAGAVAIFGVIGVVLLFVLFLKYLKKRSKE